MLSSHRFRHHPVPPNSAALITGLCTVSTHPTHPTHSDL